MGLRWSIFRFKYEILKKINYFRVKNRQIIQKSTKVNFDKIRFPQLNIINKNYVPLSQKHVEKAENAINGKIFAFSNTYLDYTIDELIDWNINPLIRNRLNNKLQWFEIPDFGEYGDIKLIWEASRFPQIFYFIHAYAATKNEKYAINCINQINDWCERNPFPFGIHYKCGQEISFRLFNWIIALDYFYDFIDNQIKKNIFKNIYQSLLRIEINIDYARKAVRNNHSISEAAGIFIGGLVFSEFTESKYLIQKGLEYLLEETGYQIYEDGSYIQHSMNYHRLVMDVLSFIFLIAEKSNFVLPKLLYLRHQKLINFLYSMIQENGKVPNYGSNDGSHLFNVTCCEYMDFRNSLNFATAINYKKILFQNNTFLIKFFNLNPQEKISLQKNIKFIKGGYFIIKNSDIFIFTRCHSYRHRPAQNDMLHVDIWYKGHNIFCDTGSYSYNYEESFLENFISVKGHNTIMINDTDPMNRVKNFGWDNWIKSKLNLFTGKTFDGEHYGYENAFNIIHRRVINLIDNEIIIEDIISNVEGKINCKQIWNTKYPVIKKSDNSFKLDKCIISSSIEGYTEPSYISNHYNQYESGTRIIFESNFNNDNKIQTRIIFTQ